MNIWHGYQKCSSLLKCLFYSQALTKQSYNIINSLISLVAVRAKLVSRLYVWQKAIYIPLRSGSLIDKLPHSQTCVASGRIYFTWGLTITVNAHRRSDIVEISIYLTYIGHWRSRTPGECVYSIVYIYHSASNADRRPDKYSLQCSMCTSQSEITYIEQIFPLSQWLGKIAKLRKCL